MAGKDSVKNTDPYSFTVDGDTYVVNLKTASYDTLIATLGFTKKTGTEAEKGVTLSHSKALQEGVLFPLTIKCETAGNKIRSYKIVCPRTKLDTAFKELPKKKYGSATILAVRPTLRRLITV